MAATLDFNADRVLKLVRSDKVLNAIYKKAEMRNQSSVALRSIFNALIKRDKKWIQQYELTK